MGASRKLPAWSCLPSKASNRWRRAASPAQAPARYAPRFFGGSSRAASNNSRSVMAGLAGVILLCEIGARTVPGNVVSEVGQPARSASDGSAPDPSLALRAGWEALLIPLQLLQEPGLRIS